MTPFAIAARYAFFAAVATLVNLTTQAVALRIYDGSFALTLAIVFGTGTGLVTKYLLDKRWIFADYSSGARAHSKRFSLYTSTGVLTTVIFWGSEYAFDALTPDGRYRFVGAVIGLSIGYITKYRLDRRFVFRSAHA